MFTGFKQLIEDMCVWAKRLLMKFLWPLVTILNLTA